MNCGLEEYFILFFDKLEMGVTRKLNSLIHLTHRSEVIQASHDSHV